MQSFYLNCWIPSKKIYAKIKELKISQYNIIAKYIANNDNAELGSCFEDIIKKNLKDKSIYEDLTKFDKWFILTFLRATSVSPSLFFITKTKADNEVTLEYNLFNILSELSEINLHAIEIFEKENIKIVLSPSKHLYASDLINNNIFSIQLAQDNVLYFDNLSFEEKQYITSSMTSSTKSLLIKHIQEYDDLYKSHLLIKTNESLKSFTSMSLRFFDNTLFDFVRLIYVPFAKNIYKKRYTLIKTLGLSSRDIDNLTPAECDVFLGLLAAEIKESKDSKPSTTYK